MAKQARPVAKKGRQEQVKRGRRLEILTAALAWVVIMACCWLVLRGDDKLVSVLLILGGGAVWFVVLAPWAFKR